MSEAEFVTTFTSIMADYHAGRISDVVAMIHFTQLNRDVIDEIRQYKLQSGCPHLGCEGRDVTYSGPDQSL